MHNSRHRLLWLLAIMMTFSLVAAACGGDEEPEASVAEETAAASVAGSVFISGSSTVEPISIRVAELFEDIAPDVSVTVDGPGTGDGFKLFCAGETDISDASRQIKDAEKEDCFAAGITNIVELKVGIDGIAVMTNAGNDAVECLSFEQLFDLIGPNGEGTSHLGRGLCGPARRPAGHLRPRRGVGHLRLVRRDRP